MGSPRSARCVSPRRRAGATAVLLLLAGCGAATGPVTGPASGPATDPATVVSPAPTETFRHEAPTILSAAPATTAPRTVRVLLAGDVLLHDGLWEVAANDARKAGLPSGSLDFAPMFRPVHGLVAGADLAVCHLETPVGTPAGPFSGYPVFAVPPQVARGLRQTGFDACTTASNHSLDQGYDGLARTLRVLDRAGLAHAGTARSRREQAVATVLDVHGVRIALLSYTYGTNGIPVDEGRPWSVNLLSPTRIRADARSAKKAGADAVVVALHWGREYSSAPDEAQRVIARQVTRSPFVDLVYGHHTHVVQPVRRVNGTWVAFGLGNFVAQQDPSVPGVYAGLVVEADIRRIAPGEVSVRLVAARPTRITPYDAADPAMRVTLR